MEKKTSCLLCVLTALLLAVLYLWAALRPGVWLRDAFLYRQADGSFSGKDAYAAYTMQVAQTENGAEVEFTIDGETRHYRLESKAEGMSDPGVKLSRTEWSFYRDRAGRPRRRHPVEGRRWGPCRRGERHRQRRIPEIRPLAQL